MRESQEGLEKWLRPRFAFFFDRGTVLDSAVEMSYSVAHDGVWRGFVEAARLAASTQPLYQASRTVSNRSSLVTETLLPRQMVCPEKPEFKGLPWPGRDRRGLKGG